MAYIVQPKFIKEYREKGSEASIMALPGFMNMTLEQFYADREVLYGMMKSVVRQGKAK